MCQMCRPDPLWALVRCVDLTLYVMVDLTLYVMGAAVSQTSKRFAQQIEEDKG